MTVLDIRIGDAPDPRLSAREIEVLTAWLISDSKAEASRSLYLAMGTVNTHLTRIRAKYSAVGRSAPTKATLLARALQDGFIDIDQL
ncbi:LuxR family transcriptional regulator [Rhodococcus sp. Leaf278]|uniref:LuxR C-terminal-related transcriptional regulator n=1 Tax=Rhodococcus sp. Leaf278 TaxID=1736319 RepID=UPI000710014D|nr:LuxR C-terminal-related transcriptional regulator [Rhodococcus sp. Leaf278]KQU58114.1 LuxR family transcriptional regulator [Rhodococcus sp. Leaf278]